MPLDAFWKQFNAEMKTVAAEMKYAKKSGRHNRPKRDVRDRSKKDHSHQQQHFRAQPVSQQQSYVAPVSPVSPVVREKAEDFRNPGCILPVFTQIGRAHV